MEKVPQTQPPQREVSLQLRPYSEFMLQVRMSWKCLILNKHMANSFHFPSPPFPQDLQSFHSHETELKTNKQGLSRSFVQIRSEGG